MLMTRLENDDGLEEGVSSGPPVDAAKFRLTVLLIRIRGRFCGRSLGVHFFGSFYGFYLISTFTYLDFEFWN